MHILFSAPDEDKIVNPSLFEQGAPRSEKLPNMK